MANSRFELMPFQLVPCLESVHCSSQGRWWLIQEPRSLKSLILYRLAEVILEYATLPIAQGAHHNVAKMDVVRWAWRTAADANHQTDLNIREAVQHVSCHHRRRSCAVLPVR